MKKSRLLGAVCACAIALVLSTSANASTVAYSDLSSFTAATNSLTAIDFEGSWGTSWTSFSSGYTSGDVTFTPGNGYQYIGDYTTLFPSNDYSAVGSDFLLGKGNSGNGTTATFASGVTAVGLDFGHGENTSSTTMTFTLGTGEQFNVTSPTNYALTFFGITSDVAITSISWNAPTSRIIADNFVYGAAAVVPIPASVWLFGSGLIGLVGIARRKKA